MQIIFPFYWQCPYIPLCPIWMSNYLAAPLPVGKKHALNKYDQFALNTSCFGGSIGSNITPVVQFHEIFVTIIMNE